MTEYHGYLDSGCNQTIIPDISWFESFEDCFVSMAVAKTKVKMRCTAVGRIFYRCNNGNLGVINMRVQGYTFSLRNVLYSADAERMLFADMDLIRHVPGVTYHTDVNGSEFHGPNGELLFRAPLMPNGLKLIKFQIVHPVYAHAGVVSDMNTMLLHARFCVLLKFVLISYKVR